MTRHISAALTLAGVLITGGCTSGPSSGGPSSGGPSSGGGASGAASSVSGEADRYRIVDCLLPGQVRRLGTMVTYVSRPELIETAARDCEIRGGEYVLKDPASYAAALEDWQKKAEAGDIKAMLYVGEMYEKGLAGPADPAKAAGWYRRAADLGSAEAQVNLAILYERGAGVPMDRTEAARWYLRARGVPEDQLTAVLRATPPAESAEVKRLSAELQAAEEERIRLRADLAQLKQVIDQAQSGGAGAQELERRYQGQITTLQQELNAKDREIAQLQQRAEQTRGKDSPAGRPATDMQIGNYYALVIGNRNYRDPAFADLKNPERDARAIADLLQSKYGMQVAVVIDGTREDIWGALGRISGMTGSGDSLLIYYAGHGKLEQIPDKQYTEGYWLPVDSSPSNPANWINTDEINKFMKKANARHILVIADSCYAGSQFRSTPELMERRELLERLRQKPARVLLTSGGQEDKVLDAGFGDNSVFAQVLLDKLRPNQQVVLSSELFEMVRPAVVSAARAFRHEQTPEYGPIQFAGDQGGEFFFAPRGAAMADRHSDARAFAALRLHALGYHADRTAAPATD